MIRAAIPALARLTRRERSLVVEALWLIVAARVAIRALPFTAVQRRLPRRSVDSGVAECAGQEEQEADDQRGGLERVPRRPARPPGTI